MTVSSELNFEQFAGDGVTTVFVFNIQAFDTDWMTTAVGAEPTVSTIVLNDDQSDSPGGTATFAPAPVAGSVVSILRRVPLDQFASYPDYGAFPARANESALDKLTMALSQFTQTVGEQLVIGFWRFFGGLGITNNQSIYFENTNGSVDPEEVGVFSFYIADNILTVRRSDGVGGWVDLMVMNAVDSPAMPIGLVAGQDVIVPLSPGSGGSATSRQFVESLVAGAVGALTFKGFWDASGGLLPVGGVNGDFWTIAVAGVVTVSDGLNAPVPTLMSVGDSLIYDGSNAWWVGISAVPVLATQIGFNPAGTNYISTNVQDALVEADTTMFVRAAHAVAEIITGIKTFSSNPLSSSAQSVNPSALTRKDYVDNRPVIVTVITADDPAWNPNADTKTIVIEGVGGGGGGGGVASTSAGQAVVATSGSGAGYFKKTSNVIDATYALIVGAGGVGGVAGGSNDGDSGGETSVSSASLTLSALGGNGGLGGIVSSGHQNRNGLTGGIATGGDLNISGSPSDTAVCSSGEYFSNSTAGDSALGSGSRQTFSGGDGSGADTDQYGGGASGARSRDGGSAAEGGAAGDGVIIITEYT